MKNGGLSTRLLTGEQAEGKRVTRALRLVFSHLPQVDAAEQLAGTLRAISGRPDTCLLFEAVDGDSLVGACLSIRLPGRCGLLYPPRTVRESPPDTPNQLLAASELALRDRDVNLFQVSLDVDDRDDRDFLLRNGFSELATLSYLSASMECFPASKPAGNLRFQNVSPADDPLLLKLIEQSYQGTLDCPGLDGVRDSRDVLDGYREAGEQSGENWFLVYQGSKPVGCLLLTDHSEANHWELVYMGVVPAARGRACGQEMVAFAQWRARLAGRTQLVLAVDEANDPAIRIYTRAGFRPWDRRKVLIKR